MKEQTVQLAVCDLFDLLKKITLFSDNTIESSFLSLPLCLYFPLLNEDVVIIAPHLTSVS